MSSKIQKIQKNVEYKRKLDLYTLYNSLFGSVIVTVGKLSGKTEDELISDFARFSKDENLALCKNIKEVCDYIIADYKMPESYKKYIVLCYDEEGKYTPIVTVIDDEGYVQPLDRNGTYIGILSTDDFEMEYVYSLEEDENGKD